MFAVDNVGGIRSGDLCLGAFVAIGCQRGGHVSHVRAVLAESFVFGRLI